VMDNPLTLAAIVAAVLLVAGTAFTLYRVQRGLARLHASFAKLGYANREDAKKYFEEASQKVADMNTSYYMQQQKMIEEGVRKVLSESSLIIEETLLKAQKDAGDIIIKAQQEGEQIRTSTKKDAQRYYDQAIEDAVDTLEWTLEQYLMGHMDVRQHEDVITKLVDTYINERKPK
jgi:F0F1-type ATP synthase membrane subunit b/b'